MKVLIVCRSKKGKVAPFITDQVEYLKKKGIEINFCTIDKNGLKGYFQSITKIKISIQEFTPDLIHAHYGLSGLIANTQRKIPVITTYHGSDINLHSVFLLSKISILLSKRNLFVSEKNLNKAGKNNKSVLLPCGVDTHLFKPENKIDVRKELNFDVAKKYILFSGAFDNKIKNFQLAEDAVKLLNYDFEIIELKGYFRQQVAQLMNAVDVCLLTSFSEGSPQFIKEAMSCNCPIVSVDVGDVKFVTGNIEGCYITNSNPVDIAKKLTDAIEFNKSTLGRQRIFNLELDAEKITDKLIEIYRSVLIND